MSLNLVLTIPRTHEIFTWFRHKQIFLPETETAMLPEELVGSSTARPKEGLLVSPAFFQVWPSAILVRGAKFYTYWNQDDTCHLWIGNNMYPSDLAYGNESVRHALHRNMRDMMHPFSYKQEYLLGYACSQNDTEQNMFGILYVLCVSRATLIKNQYIHTRWLSITDLKKVYRKLDPWSKRIFDYIYEHPSLRKQFDLYEKERKNQ